jgi:hypothetical protein
MKTCQDPRHHRFCHVEVITKVTKTGKLKSHKVLVYVKLSKPHPDDVCRQCKRTRAEVEANQPPTKIKFYKLTVIGFHILLKKFGQECLMCPVCKQLILPGQTIAKEKKRYAERYHKECLVIPTLTQTETLIQV